MAEDGAMPQVDGVGFDEEQAAQKITEGIVAEVEQKRQELVDYRKMHVTGPDSWIVQRNFGNGQDGLMAEVARLLIGRAEFQVRTSPTQTEAGPMLVVLKTHPRGSVW